MVVTCLPAASETGNEHACTASPSRCTVQAPHMPMPQLYFVPVRPSTSRRTHSSGMSGSTSTVRAVLFTLITSSAITSSLPRLSVLLQGLPMDAFYLIGSDLLRPAEPDGREDRARHILHHHS